MPVCPVSAFKRRDNGMDDGDVAVERTGTFGNFEFNSMIGFGTTVATQYLHEGDYRKGFPAGYGRLWWSSGDFYQGTFKHMQKEVEDATCFYSFVVPEMTQSVLPESSEQASRSTSSDDGSSSASIVSDANSQTMKMTESVAVARKEQKQDLIGNARLLQAQVLPEPSRQHQHIGSCSVSFCSSTCDGKGSVLFADGGCYEGQFEDGVISGNGVYIPDVEVPEQTYPSTSDPFQSFKSGSFKQGLLEGAGVEHICWKHGKASLFRLGLFEAGELAEYSIGVVGRVLMDRQTDRQKWCIVIGSIGMMSFSIGHEFSGRASCLLITPSVDQSCTIAELYIGDFKDGKPVEDRGVPKARRRGKLFHLEASTADIKKACHQALNAMRWIRNKVQHRNPVTAKEVESQVTSTQEGMRSFSKKASIPAESGFLSRLACFQETFEQASKSSLQDPSFNEVKSRKSAYQAKCFLEMKQRLSIKLLKAFSSESSASHVPQQSSKLSK